MTSEERDKRIVEMFHADMELLRKKGHDYSSGSDSLSNFRTWGLMGILVRMDDKMARLRGYAQGKVLQVQDEGVRDTLRDLRNYAFLAQVLLDEETIRERIN
jgi:hypothetical protein